MKCCLSEETTLRAWGLKEQVKAERELQEIFTFAERHCSGCISITALEVRNA